MVMQESRCDTTDRPAAVEVSFPYALGTTTGLKPNGIARAQAAQVKTVSVNGTNLAAKMNTRGSTNSRIAEMR